MKEGQAVLKLLSAVHGALGPYRMGRSVLRRLGVREVGRAWLRRTVLDRERPRPNDITVLIGVRNRQDHRLDVALRSLREQTHPRDLVHILVVDYGSEPAAARNVLEMCRRHDAELVRVEEARVWSRARCLNVGLRRTDSKFVLTADADLVFSPRYLSDVVRTLDAHPLSVVCSPMLDLPEESVEDVEEAARSDGFLPLETWREWTTPRSEWDYHTSIGASYTAFYKLIRGYDEFYEIWGGEDDDLMRRLENLGLRPKMLPTDAFYLHQWHPKFEGVDEEERAQQQVRKRAYLKTHHSILRNDESWGRPPGTLQPDQQVARR